MLRAHAACRVPSRRPALLALLALLLVAPDAARAGGQGRDIPPYVLPVRQTEMRVATTARMVCVADPGTVCVAPYLDAPPNSTNTDGGTFRSASCPGGPPHGECRPDYISGAELTGELLVDWTVTRTPPDPLPVPDPDPGTSCCCGEYKICEVGHMELNVTAPGVSVANPLWELDSSGCDCIDPTSQPDSNFSGTGIDRWWRTRNKGATCDIALEYSWELVSRDTLLQIGQQAFPSLLCQADAAGQCTIAPVPVLIEPDGSLTKGCGDPPSDTFRVRFAQRNEPLSFVRKSHQGVGAFSAPVALGDGTGDGFGDLVQGTLDLRVNDGTNRFSSQPTGLPSLNQTGAALVDWNDDGDADLLNGGFSSGVTLYPGDGAGGFDDLSSTVLDASGTTGLQSADLNGDGLPDAVSTSSGTSRVIWNQTDGPIAPTVESVAMTSDKCVDVDSDSDRDLLGATTGDPSDLRWSANGGPGGFAAPQTAVSIATAADALVPVLGQDVVDLLRCDPYSSSCCAANGGMGCDDGACETIVCNQDSFCCNTEWDDICQDIALEQCGVCMVPGISDCCFEHPAAGCDLTSCEDQICAWDSDCCTSGWEDFCADRARGWCNECHVSNVGCTTSVDDVDAADADGDGDQDLFVSVGVQMVMIHSSPNSDYEAASSYLAWLPNLQVDDPGSSGGAPLFDTGVEPWRLIGRGAADDDEDTPGGGQLEMIDLDGDTDPDAVGVGFWYRNEGGSFTGPYALGLGSVIQGCGVDGLIGYWRFAGNALDATGCDHDGTVAGASLVPDVDGTPDSAYAFDGVDDVIDLGAASSLELALPVTISAWVRHDCAALCQIFANDLGGILSGVWLQIDSADKLRVGFGDGTGLAVSDLRRAISTTTIAPNVWTHVAGVIQGSTSMALYVNGVRESVITLEGSGGPLAYTGSDALIGNSATSTFPFEGDIDEIRFYARALSDEEIMGLAAPGAPIAASLPEPAENLALDTLFVEDMDGDGDIDIVSRSQVWEQVEALPEPGVGAMLGAGGVLLLGMARRRTRG